jgi:cytochrome c
MKSKIFRASLLVLSATGHAVAQENSDVADLVKASGCLSCHSVAEKIVGPAFKDVVAKYASDPDAVSTLTQSIKNGSRGKWGRIPMPPHSSISSEDLTTLAAWVMSNKP